MSNENELLDNLPQLRLYAQMLCGHRSLGDKLLMETIRHLDFTRLGRRQNLQVTLFRKLNATWRTSPERESSPQTDVGDVEPNVLQRSQNIIPPTLANRVHSLNLDLREAFLLITAAGLSRSQAAAVLQTDAMEFEKLYLHAETIVLERDTTDVLIIEDDIFVSADLGQIMQSMGHNIAGIASTSQQAVRLATNHPPGLILCDINLADGSSGISAVNEILDGATVPVVFITSHPDRLSTSIGKKAATIVSKPYSADQLRTVSSRALFNLQSTMIRYEDKAAA